MSNNSRPGNRRQSNASQHVDNTPRCPVCDGRKYTLVATRKLSHMSVVYERQDCQACVGKNKSSPVQQTNKSSRGGNKMLSGTGYLRNKKRRRKEEDQGNSQGTSD